MTEFIIQIDGEHGTLLVDGEEPALFGQLVGCEVRRELLLPKYLPSEMDVITPSPAPVVEVTLRLPLGLSDHVTLVRGTEIRGVHGPSGDYVTTGPGDALRARVKDWLDRADTWDDWPKVEAAVLGVLDSTRVADERDVTAWQRGYRAAADNARRAVVGALGISTAIGSVD
jgi:hypothetical protein